MKKNWMKFLWIAAIVAFTFSCSACREKAATDASSSMSPTSAYTIPSRPEGTSSGEYMDVFYVPTTDAEGHTPTGLPVGVFLAQVMVNDRIYMYRNSHVLTLPKGFEEAGVLLEVNDYKIPQKNFCGCGGGLFMSSGQKVYVSSEDDTRVFVQIDNEYYAFLYEQP